MTSFQATAIAFVLVAVGLVTLETVARRQSTWPQISDVFTGLMRRPSSRFLVMLGWWWLGWHFFVR